jgi:hypothetical protein
MGQMPTGQLQQEPSTKHMAVCVLGLPGSKAHIERTEANKLDRACFTGLRQDKKVCCSILKHCVQIIVDFKAYWSELGGKRRVHQVLAADWASAPTGSCRAGLSPGVSWSMPSSWSSLTSLLCLWRRG